MPLACEHGHSGPIDGLRLSADDIEWLRPTWAARVILREKGADEDLIETVLGPEGEDDPIPEEPEYTRELHAIRDNITRRARVEVVVNPPDTVPEGLRCRPWWELRGEDS